ncbi:adenylate/guanylate cyclase domain-containing protein [Mycolicibacterium fallax]|uniref:adenylate/guanylate cyclase domain-containing protein n=1 Tax=Mycolicibacterium fallax TaxID=1793 RepID=UPI00138CF169|nr:adenylate/guanylate cyclase domain-containing protein [Mycolicibacterium fallax]BBY98625.1 adenylate cyclase [Mycolicibacterium fallax]HOW94762.1 adenylate/guanylate cyclase domain-containing protein [Mycolicibacterium fallax]
MGPAPFIGASPSRVPAARSLPAAPDRLRRIVLHRWILAGAGVNALGGAIVFLFLFLAAPILLTPEQFREQLALAGIAVGAVLAVVLPLLLRHRRRQFAAATAWLAENRLPTPAEAQLTLAAPWDAARISAAIWTGCAVLCAGLALRATPAAAAYVLCAVLLCGLSTTGVWYLVVEWVMRPLSAGVLDGSSPHRDYGPTITRRLLAAWTLATGVPLVGIATLTIGYLTAAEFRVPRTLAAILVLVTSAVVTGLSLIVIAVRSIAARIGALRAALRRVQQGDYAVRVLVDDASEIGRLQVGFNAMTAGLAERERIRRTFGTYVDRDVAEHILRTESGPPAEEVEVTMMFVDVRGFTALAEALSPAAVVAILNRLFETIVPLVHAHGGHVDKYAGDGLLAVFGAPRRQPDHAERALTAALAIPEAVRTEFGDTLSVGVGLNSGPVIAGNVGGAGRLEFSVIGDAVNVAARVESATRQTGDTVLLTQHTRELLGASPVTLVERPGIQLKGKTAAVRLFAPLDAPG